MRQNREQAKKMNSRPDANRAGHNDVSSFHRGCRSADAATAPLPAAAAATATTATAAAPAATAPDTNTATAPNTDAATPATTAAATTAAAPSDLIAKLRLRGLFVEDIEGRQADVGKFFLAEDDFVVRGGLLRGQIRQLSPARRRRGATRQRQQTGST